MATSTQSREQIEQQFVDITPDQALGKISAMPAQMVYEARWALQQIRETLSQQSDNVQQVLEVVEPLVRAVGWAEALAFAQITRPETFQALRLGNGGNN